MESITSPRGFARDQRGVDGGAEAIVDVDYGDVGRAGVEHAEHCGKAAEGCSVAHACGHSNNRRRDKATNYAGQRAFHAGADDCDLAALQRLMMREQAVQAGDTDIEVALDRRSEKLRRSRGLFCNTKIAGPSAKDRYRSGRSWL